MENFEGAERSDPVAETISHLQRHISDRDTLLSLLAAPLEALNILPPVFFRFSSNFYSNSASISADVSKHIPRIQGILLGHIAPVWLDPLRKDGFEQILYQYFCPDVFSSPVQTQITVQTALQAYLSILPTKICPFQVELLRRLRSSYPLDRLHAALFSNQDGKPGIPSAILNSKNLVVWEDVVRCVVSVPAKVTNFYGGIATDPPSDFNPDNYFTQLSQRVEILIANQRDADETAFQSIAMVITRLVNNGLFPALSSVDSSQCSFPKTVLSRIRSRVKSVDADSYFQTWQNILSNLSSTVLSKALVSFLESLSKLPDDFDTSEESRGLVKREGLVLANVFGVLTGDEDEKWDAIIAGVLMRTHSITRARILVCWAAASDEKAVPSRALYTLLQKSSAIWTSPEHIKHSLLSHHQYLTALMLLIVSSLPKRSPAIQALAFSQAFIESIGSYISHLDHSVRRCGMLMAEVVAAASGKTLNFDQWSGSGQGQEWAITMRELTSKRDIDAQEAPVDVLRLEIGEKQLADESGAPADHSHNSTQARPRPKVIEASYDSDDSLEGYASETSSTVSPTPSELDEIEKDPTTHVGRKKINRPVYLIDLATLITGSKKPDDPQNADRIEMALNCAEDLIRRKQGFGSELEENAVNLVYAFVGLNNNYELDGFDRKRQNALNALVAYFPQNAAPALIDEFFKNQYSTEARFAILNALAFVARELAMLPIHKTSQASEQDLFPSKRLPEARHAKYIAMENDTNRQIQGLVESISQVSIDSAKEAIEPTVAPLVRERQLRLKQPQRTVIDSGSSYPRDRGSGSGSFSSLAAEYFVGPLIGRFWQFLRDEKEREFRTSSRSSGYQASGTALILNPLVLSAFLHTLLVLLHASQHSSAFLMILAPESLELAVTVGTMPLSRSAQEKEQEAAVVNAALELAVVVMDGCLSLDGGRTLCLDQGAIFIGVKEWASRVMEALELGVRFPGEGGVQEARLRRSAAGVVLKAELIISRWGLSIMGTV